MSTPFTPEWLAAHPGWKLLSCGERAGHVVRDYVCAGTNGNRNWVCPDVSPNGVLTFYGSFDLFPTLFIGDPDEAVRRVEALFEGLEEKA